MTVKLMMPHIEQRKFDNFMADFKKGKYEYVKRNRHKR